MCIGCQRQRFAAAAALYERLERERAQTQQEREGE
jgi:hypothetical protein